MKVENLEEEAVSERELLARQAIIELGKSKEVAKKDAKLLLPVAETQLEAELRKEGKQMQHQETSSAFKSNIKNEENKNSNQKLKDNKEKKL